MDGERALTEQVLGVSLRRIFTPASPVEDPMLFQGRKPEVGRLADALTERGQHAIAFGERGVGKTSLAHHVATVLRDSAPNALSVRIPCSLNDTFGSLWRKAPERFRSEVDRLDNVPDADSIQQRIDRIEDILLDEVTPESVVRCIRLLAQAHPLLIVIDEYDRIDIAESAAFADTLKTLSDDLVDATVILVGVADDVDGLFASHRSIERNLRQVFVPRMAEANLEAIVTQGFARFSSKTSYELALDPKVATGIARLSQGLPYYAHLLSASIGVAAISEGRHRLGMDDLTQAVERALSDADQTTRATYADTVSAGRSDAKFDVTLLGCAEAEVDELGFFSAAAVEAALVAHPEWDHSSSYRGHLSRFSSEAPYVLESRGEKRWTRYRFSSPLMKPFIRMVGIREGQLPPPA